MFCIVFFTLLGAALAVILFFEGLDRYEFLGAMAIGGLLGLFVGFVASIIIAVVCLPIKYQNIGKRELAAYSDGSYVKINTQSGIALYEYNYYEDGERVTVEQVLNTGDDEESDDEKDDYIYIYKDKKVKKPFVVFQKAVFRDNLKYIFSEYWISDNDKQIIFLPKDCVGCVKIEIKEK